MKYVVNFASQLHPQLQPEMRSSFDIAWHRVPFTLGCYGLWTPTTRKQHYDTLCAIDERFVIAGEHASYLPAWQEGAVLSALDAVERLHAQANA